MTPAQPHPLRCETCEYHKMPFWASEKDSRCPFTFMTISSHPLAFGKTPVGAFAEITSVTGCASHSAARDKVLEPTYDEMVEHIRWTQTLWKQGIEIHCDDECLVKQTGQKEETKCIPYKTGVHKISESTTGKPGTASFGRVNHGDSFGLFFCPLHREVAHGAVIFQKLSPILPEAQHTELLTTLTLRRQAVTLCVCHAPVRNTEVRCCVLDAENKVITVNRMMYAPVVREKTGSKESSTKKSTGIKFGIYGTKFGIGSSTQKKPSKTGSG